MPTYDFVCPACDCAWGDVFLTFAEFDEFKKASFPCISCGGTMRQEFTRCNFSFPVKMTDKGPVPTSKRGLAQLMEKRYKKRNARLDALHPYWKKRMEYFFDKRGIRKTPPSSPDTA